MISIEWYIYYHDSNAQEIIKWNVFNHSTFAEKVNKLLQDNLSRDFAKIMNYIADNNQLWDKPIDELDWDVDVTECDEID